MSGSGYQSWFVSARDPASPRALWIRHTRHRPRQGPGSAALWCTVVDPDLGQRPVVVKQVFGILPAEAAAGPRQFLGSAAMGKQTARWDLSVTGDEAPLRPLRPPALYRAPLPRTKLEASLPDCLVSGTLDVNGHPVPVSGWRGTVGHNWGSEHADSWVWLHAAGFGAAPDGWLELVLARIRVGRARSPWTAMGALSIGGERIPLGGLGRRPSVEVSPDRLTGRISSPGTRLELSVTTQDADAVAVSYADPRGGHRAVRHAALAAVELTCTAEEGVISSCSAAVASMSTGLARTCAGSCLRHFQKAEPQLRVLSRAVAVLLPGSSGFDLMSQVAIPRSPNA